MNFDLDRLFDKIEIKEIFNKKKNQLNRELKPI